MGSLGVTRSQPWRRLGLMLLLCVLLFQTACVSESAMDKAADDADRDITTGIIVAIVFIGLIALAVSEVDTQQPASTDLRDCFVSNKAGLSLEMFVDGQPVGLLEAGGTLEVALERGRHEFSWYQYWGSAARQAAHQVLEVGSEPGHYELTLQPVSAGS